MVMRHLHWQPLTTRRGRCRHEEADLLGPGGARGVDAHGPPPARRAAAGSTALCTGWEAVERGPFDGVAVVHLAHRYRAGGGEHGPGAVAQRYVRGAPALSRGQGGLEVQATVPVWFPVVTDGEIGNVTQAQIEDQMTVLNLAFAGFYGGAKSGFRFELAGVTRTDNADWFYGAIDGSSERPMKKALHRGGFETLNVYSTTAGPYLGWAYLPGLPDSLLYLDGIVFDWEAMPGTSATYAGKYDLGMTLVHEAGHWVNLEHTFYGGCNAKGDFVDDTPAMKVPTRAARRARTPARPGARPDPQLHGLLVRPCQGVHRGAGSPRAGRLALLPRVLARPRAGAGAPARYTRPPRP